MNFIIEYKLQIFLIFLAVNIFTFFAYGADKYKAIHNKWRIPESTLILFAAVGGSVGAYLGMRFFHHKTRHPKFYIGVPIIFVFQIALIIFLILKFGK